MTDSEEESSLKLEVEERYSKAASQDPAISCCSAGNDYDEDIPLSARNGALGCGSPVNYLALREGLTVVDVGSGSGVDVFAVANRLKAIKGKVIGIDSTLKMVARSRRTAAENHYDNVEFRLGEMENLPVESSVADIVISNCAVNLVPDKLRAFKEMFRILKIGGYLTISDIVAKSQIPQRIRDDPARWTECVSGALSVKELEEIIKGAGFVNFRVIDEKKWDKTDDKDLDLSSLTFYAEKS